MLGKKKHDHKWYEVLVKEATGLFNIKYTMHVVYCPICDKQRELDTEQWTITKNAQKIKNEFKLEEGDKG